MVTLSPEVVQQGRPAVAELVVRSAGDLPRRVLVRVLSSGSEQLRRWVALPSDGTTRTRLPRLAPGRHRVLLLTAATATSTSSRDSARLTVRRGR